jgi:GT2 family glycosyltransferase
MDTLDLSMVTCTYDRPERLRAMLESACAMSVPAGLAWEVLIVDNGGSDAGVGTSSNAEVARSFAGRLPIRVVREPAAGLCHARNRGVREAEGRYLCWTDDDTLLDRSWLAAYVEAFARHPEAALFGGRILPKLDPPAPLWLERRLHDWPVNYVVAHRDMGDEETPVTIEGGRLPWGANFAARAAEQRRHPYNVELGFSPNHRRTGEETDVAYRILKAGGSGWWVPGAKVEHAIPAERQSRAYILDYYDQAGHTAAFLHDRFPGDHSLAAFGALPFERFGRVGLRLASAAAGLVSAAAGLAGLTGLSLRFLARRGYYRGIAAHRSERQAALPLFPPRPAEAERPC